ncbi:MAG TPA: SH3 domain-containing protein, partial [Caldilineaceae bacterium]|nr:SH3 domain-containing protein [Caldilineaceae bacterium]
PSPAQAVAASGESSTSLAGTVAVPGSRLNVRAGPGAAYAIVGKLTDGASVSLLARSGDSSWVQVALAEGAFGWVSARYITTKGGVESLPISTATSGAKAAQSLPAPAPASQSARSQPAGLPGKLALAAADGSIVLYNLTSGATSRLTNGFDPAISPDGQRVAFLRGGQGLLVMDIDGSNERMLYNGVELRAPAWSPDGQYVVFSRVNGQEPCRDPGFGLCLPDVPQFAHYPLVIKDLRVISRIGTDSKDFEDIPSQKTAMSPSWTEAGIVYQSSDGLQITQDGPSHDKEGNPVNRQVTNLYIHRDPAWRPDGWLIAFVDDRPVHREIYVVDPNGNGMTALTRPASALLKEFPHNVAPVWSPDGQQIAFLSNRDGDWGVFAMNADGSNQRRLPVAVEMTYRFQSEQSISWGR